MVNKMTVRAIRVFYYKDIVKVGDILEIDPHDFDSGLMEVVKIPDASKPKKAVKKNE